MLLHDYGFPLQGPAFLAVDYLNRVPVVGLTGMMGEEGRSGEAAAALRALARQHGWAVIAAAALKSESFKDGEDSLPCWATNVSLMKPTGCYWSNAQKLYGNVAAPPWKCSRSKIAPAPPGAGRSSSGAHASIQH